MHAIHTTSGFIIDSQPHSEAGMRLIIFTRDFGLITATAQGIRLEKSKLRYHTQKYFFGDFSLIRGKEFWKLTSAEASPRSERRGSDVTSEPLGQRGLASSELIARLAFLLRRLLHGEEANTELFDCIENCGIFLKEHQDISIEQLKTLESIMVLRIMHLLGYVGDERFMNDQLKSKDLSFELLDGSIKNRTLFNQCINKALKESHL